jgi:uncharacterized protein (TIGR02145 family)
MRTITIILSAVSFIAILSCSTPTTDSVKIGGKEWMVKNLDVSTFRNGDPIPQAKTKEEWYKANIDHTPAWCYYNNDIANGKKFGKISNYYVLQDHRGIAPDGWHIPSMSEWKGLLDSLGENAAGKLKSKDGWQDNKGNNSGNGTNESGFTGLPGGHREKNGEFERINESGYWWSATVDGEGIVLHVILSHKNNSTFGGSNEAMGCGE